MRIPSAEIEVNPAEDIKGLGKLQGLMGTCANKIKEPNRLDMANGNKGKRTVSHLVHVRVLSLTWLHKAKKEKKEHSGIPRGGKKPTSKKSS